MWGPIRPAIFEPNLKDKDIQFEAFNNDRNLSHDGIKVMRYNSEIKIISEIGTLSHQHSVNIFPRIIQRRCRE